MCVCVCVLNSTDMKLHLCVSVGKICRVIDSDGEFLMIEAAESLPRWADPDTCINRVNHFESIEFNAFF